MKNILEGKWLIKATERYMNNGEWCAEPNAVRSIATFDQAELKKFSFIGVLTEEEDNQCNCISTYHYFPHPQNRLHVNKAMYAEVKIYQKSIYEVEPLANGEGYYLNLINDPDNTPPYLRFIIVPIG